MIADEWRAITGAAHVQAVLSLDILDKNIVRLWADGLDTVVRDIPLDDFLNGIEYFEDKYLKPRWEPAERHNSPWTPPIDMSLVRGDNWAEIT